MSSVFDPIADAYDGWYDAIEGSSIFHEEVECLRLLCNDFSGRWLEVGVGTGRFAKTLGISNGIDLSVPMALRALKRGVSVCIGNAGQLPFPQHVFDGVLMALTLMFLENPETALQECARVLRGNGKIVLGTVPADSSWGRAYIREGDEGHPVYAYARFRTIKETLRLFEKLGFRFLKGCSALFWNPGTSPDRCARVETGIVAEAGFVGLLFDAHHSGV